MFPSTSTPSILPSSLPRSRASWYQTFLRLLALSTRTYLIFFFILITALILMNLAFAHFSPSSRTSTSTPPSPPQAQVDPPTPPPKPSPPPPAIDAVPAPPPAPLAPATDPPASPLSLNSSTSPLWSTPASTYCDRQFGNGFSTTSALCHPSASPSSLTCHHNPLTESTICEGRHLHLDPAKVRVSAGDEDIASVRWRTEAEEFPSYDAGAFTVDCRQPQNPPPLIWPIYRDHLSKMFGALAYTPLPTTPQCEVVEEAVLLTRYEYANLYHTMTDWYNVYQAMHMLMSNPTATPHVIFLDGHSKGSMDAAWPTLFSPHIRYVKSLTTPLCIKHAVFVSPGYGSALAPNLFNENSARCVRHPLVLDFARFVQRRFRLGREEGDEVVVVKDIEGKDVVIGDDGGPPLVSFIVRRSYLAHPRVKMEATERTMVRETETLNAAATALAALNIRFHGFDFTQLPLHTQLNVLYHSSVLVGMHGAALSHILYMKDEAALVELMPSGYNARQHFKFFALWSGHQYQAVSVMNGGDGGYQVDPESIVNAVRIVVRGAEEGGDNSKEKGKGKIAFSKIKKGSDKTS